MIDDISKKTQNRLSYYLYRFKFLDMKLLKSNISDKKYIIQNYLNIVNLSIFNTLSKIDNCIYFTCQHNFAITVNENKSDYQITCYAHSSYYIYTCKNNYDELQLILTDIPMSITVNNKDNEFHIKTLGKNYIKNMYALINKKRQNL